MRKIRISERSYRNYCSNCADCLSAGGSNPKMVICRKDSCGVVKELRSGKPCQRDARLTI